jgi:astacin
MRYFLALAVAWSAWAQPEWRQAEIDGRTLRYQVIDGEAVWQGDIVLGPAESLEKGARASAVISGARFRWPDNVIPYVIDADVPDPDRVTGAIRNWNENTPVRLVPRQNEANYVQFRRRNGAACSSNVGMTGGRQFINLPDSCSLGSVIHEIGHAFGLWHTQSREDRDLYIRLNEDGIERENLSQFIRHIADGEDIGAYPFDSIMHYSTTGFALPGRTAIATIPAGIPLGQRAGLSASDIDTIIRVGGGQPSQTVIASNPSGLTVLVDGQSYQTPAAFRWPAGSRHTLRIDDVDQGATRLRFAAWSNFGEREQTIVASPDVTVFTAQMRRLFPLPLAAAPAAAGRIAVQPEPEADGVPDGQLVELRAEAAPGFTFTNWSGFGYFSTHGSANPVQFSLQSDRISYTASFTTANVTTVTTSPPGLRIVVDGTTYTAPRNFVWAAGSRHDVDVEATTQTTLGGAATHTWRGWSDGGAQRHFVTAPDGGGSLTAEFATQYQVLSGVTPSAAGRVVIDPPASSGLLREGSTVTVTAVPNPGFAFAAWAGNLPGGEARKTFPVEGPLDLQAQFAQPGTLTAAGFLNGAAYLSGPVAPGEIVAIFGIELGPEELAGLTLTAQRRVATAAGGVRVLFDGTPAPVLYASSRQVGVVVPFNVAGKSVVRVQLDNNGRLTNLLTVNVVVTAPALFTAEASGRGAGAFLNSDGSLNTAANPAARGSIVVLYATGLGTMRPAMNDGELAGPPYAQPVATPMVRIAGRVCEILYGGAAPGLVAGLIQLNVRVPADIGPGLVPVTVEAGGISSPRTVGLAVR